VVQLAAGYRCTTGEWDWSLITIMTARHGLKKGYLQPVRLEGIFCLPPKLTAPANGVLVSSTNVTLTWDPVNGAIVYSISVRDMTNHYSYDFYTTAPNLNLSESGWFIMAPNTNYEWNVVARNDYAWGNSSTSWSFSTTAQ